MPLIAPRVLIHRRVEDSIGGMQHEPELGKVLGDSESRRKVVLVGIHQPLRIAVLAANEHRRHAIVEDQIGVGIVQVIERTVYS